MPQHVRGDDLGPVRQVHFGGTQTGIYGPVWVAGRAAACNGWVTERGRLGGLGWPRSMCRPRLST